MPFLYVILYFVPTNDVCGHSKQSTTGNIKRNRPLLSLTVLSKLSQGDTNKPSHMNQGQCGLRYRESAQRQRALVEGRL